MLDPQRIWSSSQLPTLPTVAVKLLDLVRNPETTIEDVIGVVRTDPAISAKIIKAANGTYFGLRTQVKAIDRAISLLGTTVSTSLALSFALSDDSMRVAGLKEHYNRYWKQSVVQAAAAECLGKTLPGRDASEFFLVGLLQDLGRLAMLKTIPQEYLPVLDQFDQEQRPLEDLETEFLGFNHAFVGAKLMETWKLPQTLIRAAECQSASLEELQTFQGDAEFSLYLASAMASAVGSYFCSPAKGASLERMRQLVCYFYDSDDGLEHYLRLCEQRIQETANLFDVDVSDLGDSASLMMMANEQLVQLTLREHVSNTQTQMSHVALTQEKSRLEEQNRTLQAQAVYDPLTQLHNRKYFDESLHRECNRCQRQAAPVAVIFADIDRFKALNDQFGHAFGDLVLREIAQRFKASVRASDIVARYGGEEFVILVYQPTEKGVETLANRIRERIEGQPFADDERSITVTCSLGAAIAIPGRRERNVGERLLAAADQAMYSAKKAGRNRATVTSLVSEQDRQLHQLVNTHRFSRWLVQQKLLEIPAVSRALLECPMQTLRIGELAVQYGYLTDDQVAEILKEQEQSEERFGSIATRRGDLTAAQLVHLLTLQHENPQQLMSAIVRLGLLAPDAAAAALEDYGQQQLALAADSVPVTA